MKTSTMWPYFLGTPFPISFLEVRHYENSWLHSNLGSYQDIVGNKVPNKLVSLKRKSRVFFNGYEKITHKRLIEKKSFKKNAPCLLSFLCFLYCRLQSILLVYVYHQPYMDAHIHEVVFEPWQDNLDEITWSSLSRRVKGLWMNEKERKKERYINVF